MKKIFLGGGRSPSYEKLIGKPDLKVYFTDFWEGFDKSDNFFTKILSKDFNVIVIPENPDILIYTCYNSREFLNYDCIRIFYTQEMGALPKYKECDFSLSFEYWKDLRNLRMPNYLLYNIHPDQLKKDHEKIKKLVERRTKFCSRVVTNPGTKMRNDFFHRLSQYKKVDSGGRHLNNIGRIIKNKLEFISEYKFNLCFENSQHIGYTSEKLVEAMASNTIPIYWGDPLIRFEFNTKSFFNYNDYSTEDDLIEDIIEHDRNPDKYFEKLLIPWFEDDVPNQFFDHQRIRKFLYDIIMRKDSYTPIAKNKFKRYFYFPIGYRVNMLKGRLGNVIKKVNH